MKHFLIFRQKLWYYLGDGLCATGYDQQHAYEQWLEAKKRQRAGRFG